MDKIEPTIKVTKLDDSTQQKMQGKNIDHAPQPSITAPVGIAGSYQAGATYGSNEENLINNHTQQIIDIESALVRLGLLKSR